MEIFSVQTANLPAETQLTLLQQLCVGEWPNSVWPMEKMKFTDGTTPQQKLNSLQNALKSVFAEPPMLSLNPPTTAQFHQEGTLDCVGGFVPGTTISLHRGVSSHDLLQRRKQLLVFLKGSGRDRVELRKCNAQKYKHFEKVWQGRQNHIDKTMSSCWGIAGNKTVPTHYVQHKKNGDDSINQPTNKRVTKDLSLSQEWSMFPQRLHWNHGGRRWRMDCYICENCKEAKISQDDCIPAWYPGGPSFSFFPYPVINSTRLWGSKCTSCRSCCSGHYVTQVDQL